MYQKFTRFIGDVVISGSSDIIHITGLLANKR